MSALFETIHASQEVLADGGILDFVNVKTGEAQTAFRSVGSLAAIGFVVWQAIAARGSMARIITAGIAAGIFLWIVFNVTDLQDKVDNEINGSPTYNSISAHGFTAPSAIGGSR